MTNQAINYFGLNYATGNKTILQSLADYFVAAARSRGTPLAKITNVSSAIAKQGDVARIPVTATTASSLLTDGSQRVLDDTTPTTVDITMSTNRYSSYSTTSVASLLSGNALDFTLFSGRVSGLLNDTEGDVMGNFVTSCVTNVNGTYGTALTESTIVTAVASVLSQKPPKDPFHAFVSPTSWGQLVQIANFNSGYVRGYLPGEPAPSVSTDYGESGRPWHNCYWHLCNSLTEPSVSGNGNPNNVIFHSGAVGIAMRPLDSEDFHGSTGYMSVPFADAEAGVAGSVVYAKNFLTFSDEISIRLLYGYSTALKEQWTALMKS